MKNMQSFSTLLTQCRILCLTTFTRLSALLQQIYHTVGNEAIFITDDLLYSVESIDDNSKQERFAMLVSERFSALLLGELIQIEGTDDDRISMNLTFSPEAIATFSNQLAKQLNYQSLIKNNLERIPRIIRPNDAIFQSEFTLALIEIISHDFYPISGQGRGEDDAIIGTVYACKLPSFCKSLETVLRQQIEQERLIDRVVTQIRQSLELSVILSTAVEQVRQFLRTDRLLIYQFNIEEKLGTNPKNNAGIKKKGCVTYEVRATEEIAPLLHYSEGTDCFVDVPSLEEKYSIGLTRDVEDIEIAYADSACFLEFLRRIQVRAKLIVPIVVKNRLWGLLIAHQCYHPRQWLDSEKTFLEAIAEHLAIAIYQAQLYAQLKRQKQNLEQRVSDRTAELHDALMSAQAANRAKSEFLAGISHELRTPLTCVIGMSATLLRLSFDRHRTKQLSVEKQKSYLQTIHDSGKHLLELIDDLLDLSVVEAGKAVLSVSIVSLSRLAYQCRQIIKQKADINGVKLDVEMQVDPKRDRFTADKRRLQQILLNLLSNAVKFTPAGGQVILRVWVEENTAIFQVEDTGIGIQEEQRSLLFEKFRQLDTSYHRNYEGMGLGLALTKQLVELHSGIIEVESTVDVGSVFTVRLPAQPLTLNEGKHEVGQKNAVTPQGRVVLIEDDEESAWTICDLLTAAGYQVVWLVEGTTAVMQIKILRPLVVIAAAQLPGIAGSEIVRVLRSEPTTKQIKIILLADSAIARDAFKSREAGANDYLAKPLQPERLLHKINSLIARQTPE